MAWVESHQELRNHPKTKRAARLAGTTPRDMVGILHYLWWWALDYAESGDLTGYNSDDIESALDWDGEPGKLIDALIDCGIGSGAGFIERTDDGHMLIHDWDEFAGRLIEQRHFQAERKKRKRDLYDNKELTRAVRARDGDRCRYCGCFVDWSNRKGPGGGTYDHIDPEGPNIPDNIAVACRRCNAEKNRRTPEQAGMSLLPAGYPTTTGSNQSQSGRLSADNGRLSAENPLDHTIPDLTEPDQNYEDNAPHPKAAAPHPRLPPAVQIYLDNGGKFPAGKLTDGTSKQDRAIQFIAEHIRDDPASLELWGRVVASYCAQWSAKSYTVMINDYYLVGRIPGQPRPQSVAERSNGHGPANRQPHNHPATPEEMAPRRRAPPHGGGSAPAPDPAT